MQTKWYLPLLFTLFTATATSDELTGLSAPQLIEQYKSELQQALLNGMAQGPVKVLSSCKPTSKAIQQTYSAAGITVGRSSQKLRNPANQAPDWVQPLLVAYANNPADRSAKRVSLAEGREGYVEPIILQPICLTCHGETLAPAIASEIKAHYPMDQAIGYKPGDLGRVRRGSVTSNAYYCGCSGLLKQYQSMRAIFVQITQATGQDKQHLIAFWQKLDQSQPESPLNYETEARLAFHKKLAEQVTGSEKAQALLAWLDDKPVAVVCGHIHDNPQYQLSPVGIIYNLWVEPDYRRKAIASKLVKALEQRLQSLNVRSIQVAWRDQQQAGRFWHNMGYQPVETIAAKPVEMQSR